MHNGPRVTVGRCLKFGFSERGGRGGQSWLTGVGDGSRWRWDWAGEIRRASTAGGGIGQQVSVICGRVSRIATQTAGSAAPSACHRSVQIDRPGHIARGPTPGPLPGDPPRSHPIAAIGHGQDAPAGPAQAPPLGPPPGEGAQTSRPFATRRLPGPGLRRGRWRGKDPQRHGATLVTR
jgi:hypothetical protein